MVRAGRQNGVMERTVHVEAAYAQRLTEELLACSGIRPGMRVLVVGRDLAELALLVAERVGSEGGVIALSEDARVIAQAHERALEEGFDYADFRAGSLENLVLDAPVDAVIGRFFLMYQPDPVRAIRLAARLLRDGGRLVFHEWHYDSILWEATSDWPDVPLYRRFARWSIAVMRRNSVHVDMGLRLVNVFTEAGLPLPSVRSDWRIINGSGSLGYTFFESALRDLLLEVDCRNDSTTDELPVDTFAQRLERETIAAGGHVFLPLQVGAWTCVPAPTSPAA